MMQEVDFTVNLVHIEMSIERSVILNEEDKDGRMILTTDEEERMQRVSWTEINLCKCRLITSENHVGLYKRQKPIFNT